MKYKIIIESDCASLNSHVNEYLDNGYELYGQPIATENKSRLTLMQAVIKKKDTLTDMEYFLETAKKLLHKYGIADNYDGGSEGVELYIGSKIMDNNNLTNKTKTSLAKEARGLIINLSPISITYIGKVAECKDGGLLGVSFETLDQAAERIIELANHDRTMTRDNCINKILKVWRFGG